MKPKYNNLGRPALRSLLTLMALPALLLGSTHTHASVVRVWEGNADATLLTAGNWVGGVAPVSNNALQFGVVGSAGTNLTNATNFSFGYAGGTPSFNFTTGASAYIFSGSGSIAIGTGGVTNASGQTQTFNSPVRFNTGNNHTLTSANSALSFGGQIELNTDTTTLVLGSSTGQSVTFGNNLVLGTVNPGNPKNVQLNGGASASTVNLNGATNAGLTGTLRIGSNVRTNIGSSTGLSAATTVNFNGNGQLVNTAGSALATNASLAINTSSSLIFGQAGDTAANSIAFNGTTAISADLNRAITLNGTGLNVTSGSVWNNSATGSRTTIVNGVGNTLSFAGVAIGATAETENITFTLGGSANLTITGGVTNGLGTGTRALQHNGAGLFTIQGASDYSGNTGVGSNATLLVNGTHSGGTGYSVQGILGGTGTIDLSANNGSVSLTTTGNNRRIVASSADGLTIIGDTAAALNLINAAGRTDTFQSFHFTLNNPGTTVVDVQGLLSIGTGILEFDDFSFTAGSGFGPGTYRLFQYETLSGTLGSSLTGQIGGFDATISNDPLTNSIVLTVVGGPSGYSTWAAANVGGQAANLDFDNDGTQNGVEYFLNSPAGFTALPVPDATRKITWNNGGNIPASEYKLSEGGQFEVQTSINLITWTPVPAGSLSTNTNSQLSYTLPAGQLLIFARLVVLPD